MDVAESYGLAQTISGGRGEAVSWAFLDGRWDDAGDIAEPLVADVEAGQRDYTDVAVLAARAAIALARGDLAAADGDSRRAADLARPSDAQAHAIAFTVRAQVALAVGARDEADALATDLVGLGPVLLPALCSPYPNLAEVAWVFRDLGREEDLLAVLEAIPIASPWMDAARAILAGDLVRAADILDEIGHLASAAHARDRAAEALEAEGRGADAEAQRKAARAFQEVAGVR
jgi:hypothetical protein